MRWILPLALCALAFTASAADRFERGAGVTLASGARVTALITPAGDTDDFVVAARAGQRLKARLRANGKDGLAPTLALLTPEGEPGPPATRGRLNVVLPASGIWTLRVGGDAGSFGAYRLDVTLAKPKAVRDTATEPDGDLEFTTLFEAGPGDRVDVKARAKGGRLAELGVRAPAGEQLTAARTTRRTARVPLTLSESAAAGTYVAFVRGDAEDAPGSVRFTVKVAPPQLKGKRRRVRLEDSEPRILTVPAGAGIGVPVTFTAQNASDAPVAFLGDTQLTDVVVDGTTVRALVPAATQPGMHVLHLRTAAGQWASSAEPLPVGPIPRVTSLSPSAGPSVGGFEITITGTDLPPGEDVGLVISGFAAPPMEVLEATPTRLRLLAPARPVGAYVVRVRNVHTGLTSAGLGVAITYQPTPRIDRVSPGLVIADGEAAVTVTGAEFASGDRVYVETSFPGEYEALAAGTFVSESTHRFVAPRRPPGTYAFEIESALGHRRDVGGTLTYFTFEDGTDGAGLGDVTGDDLAAASTAFADLDGDGHDELILGRTGGAVASADLLTRVLRSTGGAFADVTEDVLPEPPSGDDWRADRVRAVDFDGDGHIDLALLSASPSVPPSGRSGLRLLRNVSAPSAPGGRAFVDVTLDRMAPPRMKRFINTAQPVVGDDWRGLDLWIGDLDGDGGAVPELVVTGGATFTERYVFSGNYAVVGSGVSYSYGMYWPATRVFTWDAEARGGLGSFRFAANQLPRRQGLSVFLGGAPPGVYTGTCNSGTPCEHTITPFAGTSLEVTDIDGDGRRDIVVVTPDDVVWRESAVSQELLTTSSLQVALGSAEFVPLTGSWMRDITETLRDADVRGTVVAAGNVTGGDAHVLAVSSADAAGVGGLRLLAYDSDIDVDPIALVDVTDAVLASLPAGDAGEARDMTFHDLDLDGRDDLILVSVESSGGGAAALRILRSVSGGAMGWRLVPRYADILDGVRDGDELDATSLAIGDLDGDVDGAGLPAIAITRDEDGGSTPETRVIRAVAD